MLVWKVTPETERIYGRGEGAEFAVPCTYCNGYVENTAKDSIGRSNVPEIFARKTIDDFDWTLYGEQSMEKIKSYIRGFLINYKSVKKDGIGFYIYSRAKGTGKTLLASCILNTLINSYGIVGKFVSAYQIIDIVKSPDRYEYKYGQNPIKVLTNCELLVIDDIGAKQTGQDWLNDLLFQIIDERMKARRMTVYTSNYEACALPYDDRIKDRISSTTQTVILPDVKIRQEESLVNKRERLQNLTGGLQNANNS